MLLYHGSEKIIKNPVYGLGAKYNDYGPGFYCTKKIELAKEWACKTSSDGYANEYVLNEDDLNILDLTYDVYSILHWLCILVEHRQFDVNTPIMQRGHEWLVNNYHIDISQYDIVKGYRADDSYFSFARAFLSNQISLQQLEGVMGLGELGIQYVLISEKAFGAIEYKRFEIAPSDKYYLKRMARDHNARENYRKIASEMDFKGTYIRDLME